MKKRDWTNITLPAFSNNYPLAPFKMRHLIIISAVFVLMSCLDNQKKPSPIASDRLELTPGPDKNLKEEHLETKTDITACDKTALDFLKLANKNIQTDFFHQLDSIRKVQYPQNDQDKAIFVDLTPALLDRFLRDLNKSEFSKTGKFKKEYYFGIAPPKYTDSKECKDAISITFDKKTCSFLLVIYNEFPEEWCQESSVIYGFKINGNRISDFGRNEAG